MSADWAKGAVYYQIFPDRFFNGDPDNDVKTGQYSYVPGGPVIKADWESPVETTDVHRFYGGDLAGIWEKLPYLKNLGVDVILLNPIFRSPSNHKYDCACYDEIDPHLAGGLIPGQTDGEPLSPNEYFAAFVRAVHDAGMKIVLDGVFNHCSNENPWFADPEKSDYFVKKENGENLFWWNIKTLPKLHYEEGGELWNEMLRIAAKWVSEPYNCDGWRLDVAADLGESPEINHKFWKAFNETVKAANPDAVVFAEHYGSGADWIKGGEWDSVMNYDGFMDPVSGFFTGADKHCDRLLPELYKNAEAFKETLLGGLENLPGESADLALNQLDNHDHARYITRTGGRIGRLNTAGTGGASEQTDMPLLMRSVVFQMTWQGCPGIYYGDETALPGWTDPDSRRPFPWGKEDFNLIDFYKRAVLLHKSSPVFKDGETKILMARGGLFAFARTGYEQAFITLINEEDKELDIAIPLTENALPDGSATQVFETGKSYNVGQKALTVSGGELPLAVKPYSSLVIKLI